MPPKLNTPNWKIVCIDDDPDIEKLLAHAAMEYPHVMFYIHKTKSGGEHRLVIENYEVDAVVLDIALQDGSGREATKSIRKKEHLYPPHKMIEIFWYTGMDIDLDNIYDPRTQTYYACQVRQLFKKPYPADDMFKVILTFLGIPLKNPRIVLEN